MTPAPRPLPAGVAELWPGSTLSRRPGRRPALLVLPMPRAPRMLVPTGVPGADRMLRRFSRGRAQSAAQSLLGYGVRSGLLQWLPVARLTSPGGPATTDSITDRLRAVVPATGAVGVLLGPPRANAKPVLQVFDADGRTVAFAKVGHTPAAAALVRREAQALADPGLRALQDVRVAEVLHSGSWHEMELLVTSALESSQSRTHSWELPVAAVQEVALSTDVEWSEVGASRYWSDLGERVAALGDPGRELGALLGRLTAAVAPVTLGFGRWHGDWSPWNSGRLAGRLELWDWEQSTTGVPLGLDAVHFVVQRGFADGAGPQALAAAVLDAPRPVLRRWYAGENEVVATALLYLLEILHRYTAQAVTDPGPDLAHRTRTLTAVADLVAGQRRPVDVGRGA